ncbi:MAG: enoyl-CoA hydratase-related protein [Pseudohongiellaceae bacterium]
MQNRFIEVELSHAGICRLSLNRPEKHNAFHPEMMQEIINALHQLQHDEQVRVLVLTGNGKSFSSGADLNYMKSMVKFDHAENVGDARRLASLLQSLNEFSRPVISAVNGNAFAGAIGLIACSDIIVAASDAAFCISETRLGIAPAVISPYVVNRIGIHYARRYFLTAEVFNAETARQMNLVHEVVAPGDLLATAYGHAAQLLNNSPDAISATKRLIHRISPAGNRELADFTCELIARLRAGDEGQQGLAAFFDKTSPPWVPDPESQQDQS